MKQHEEMSFDLEQTQQQQQHTLVSKAVMNHDDPKQP